MSRNSEDSHRPRPSECIKRSHELERQRIDRLSIEERIQLALRLKENLAELIPTPRSDNSDEISAEAD